ncbi:MAG TPA: GNAT family N-acetyltransferase [Egicoccus sp.]|nr:GNAT family N-acetyltransferase [Egicoccus sp.]HSK25231.1 GNAT family N-acetyltransferase [Egicoccus sp.]
MASDVTIGRVDADEYADFRRVFTQTFGYSMSEEDLARIRPWQELDRAVAARVDGRIVGTSGAYSFDLSMPGADTARCAGVTVVSVRADQRRRGVLTSMMRQLFDDADERGEPFAALWASEAPIYGRFGFGPAAPGIHLEIERANARLREPVATAEVELVDRATAAERFPPIYEAARRRRPGMLGFADTWWERLLEDDPNHRDGAGEKRYALLADRGFAIYRLKEGSWDGGLPDATVHVQELIANDAEATAIMWQFVIDTDLSATTRAGRRPADDPLPLLLQDAGRAKVNADWPLYVALVDLPTALASRGYGVDDTLTLRVHDRFRGSNDGTWRLSTNDGKAVCEAADGAAEADVELDADVLGALILGGQRATRYAAAGRLTTTDPGGPARLDRLFATDVAPWTGVMF